jgi:hypothetical protein
MTDAILKRNGLLFGIVIGSIACLVQAISYAGGEAVYKSGFYGFFTIVTFWAIRIYQIISTKKELNNIISFKDCFKTLLISTSIGILFSVIFNYIFYNFISPEFKIEMNEFMNGKQFELYKLMGKTTSELNLILKNDNFSLENLIKGGLFSIIISSIFNLILSAIFKSKQSI